jgi:hypothetical protein
VAFGQAEEGYGMREDSLTMRGATVRSLPRPNRVWAHGRTCAEEGCITQISIYNKSKYCWAHEPIHYYIARGRKKRREAA